MGVSPALITPEGLIAAIGLIVVIAGVLLFLTRKRGAKPPAAAGISAPIVAPTQDQSQSGALVLEDLKSKLPEIPVRKVVPRKKALKDKVRGEIPDNWGSFLYFLLMAGALMAPVILFLEEGLSVVVGVVLFCTLPCITAISGYLVKRFRTPKAARDLAAMLNHGDRIGITVGPDNIMKMVPFRRGATGRWHGPNMEIVADAVQKATYPFAGTQAAFVHSKTEGMLNPDFLYEVSLLNANSSQIGMDGPDGKPKNSMEIMDILDSIEKQEEEWRFRGRVVKDLKEKKYSLIDFLDKNYRAVLYAKDGTLKNDILKELTDQWTKYQDDDGKMVKDGLAHIANAKKITVGEFNYHIEYARDALGRIIEGRMIHDRVLSLFDWRNYLPTGGTAEDGFQQSRNAEIAGGEESGKGQWDPFWKWFGPFMIILSFFIGVAMLFSVHAI